MPPSPRWIALLAIVSGTGSNSMMLRAPLALRPRLALKSGVSCSIHERAETAPLVNNSYVEPTAAEPTDVEPARAFDIARSLGVLWRFSRPHTMIGSALCIPSLTLFAMPTVGAASLSTYAAAALYALPAALLMNVYIVGLNQLFDVEVDKVNKPDLPLAAGDLNPRPALAIVLGSLISSLTLGFYHPTLRPLRCERR